MENQVTGNEEQNPSDGQSLSPRPAPDALWYLGVMSDGCFVIDQPPQPGPVDHVCTMDHGVNVIVACGSNGEAARLLVAEHNARVALTMPRKNEMGPTKREFEFCPTCGSELDTGWECNACGLDWRDWVLTPPVIQTDSEN
jgi:hypothetical protein